MLRKASVRFDAEKDMPKIKARVLYVLSRTDKLFPPSIAPDVMARLKAAGVSADYFEIDSDFGHSASGPRCRQVGASAQDLHGGPGEAELAGFVCSAGNAGTNNLCNYIVTIVIDFLSGSRYCVRALMKLGRGTSDPAAKESAAARISGASHVQRPTQLVFAVASRRGPAAKRTAARTAKAPRAAAETA